MVHENAVINRVSVDTQIDEDSNSLFPERIVSDNLVLERIDPSLVSIQKLHELFSTVDGESVFQYCRWNCHDTIHETIGYVDRCIEAWEECERFEYVISECGGDEYIGTTYIRVDDSSSHSGVIRPPKHIKTEYIQLQDTLSSGTFGLWLDESVWGNRYGGERADIFMYIAFELFNMQFVDVGCVAGNDKSRRAIEKYISRYNGEYYGTRPVDGEYYGLDGAIPHHEYTVTQEQYESGKSGIGCMVPSVKYDEINFE